jgi:hypothetical protein
MREKKKVRRIPKAVKDTDMLPEYNFSGGVRGKYYRAMQAGYTVTIHNEDGSTVVKEFKLMKGAIVLEPDVQKYFRDSESVNAALRSVIQLIQAQHKTVAKKHGA